MSCEPGDYLEKLDLENLHNNATKNERVIELPIAKWFLERFDNVLEVGAVTPYYYRVVPIDHVVIDISDPQATIKADIFDANLLGLNVLSISTVEHFGNGDYGLKKDKTLIKKFFDLIPELNNYCITIPLGYNKIADKVVFDRDDVTYYKKYNHDCWKTVGIDEARTLKYNDPFKWANGLALITNARF